MGLSSPDDAAVYRLSDDQAVISTTDFFPPVVDDPYNFGAIAAANALSDVYAMGGQPLMAVNLVAYPDGEIPIEVLTEILRGGAEKVREAGAVIAGGHTVTDKEPKYGLAVTGLVHPREIITKAGAQAGDQLILTKALGTGVLTTALKNDLASEAEIQAVTNSMIQLSKAAVDIAKRHDVHAMTDVTGFGLVGHAQEIARFSEVGIQFAVGALRWLPGAVAHAEQEVFPGGMWNNRAHFSSWVNFGADVSVTTQYLLYDPETSGGLLMAIPPTQAQGCLVALQDAGFEAALIGEVTTQNPGKLTFD